MQIRRLARAAPCVVTVLVGVGLVAPARAGLADDESRDRLWNVVARTSARVAERPDADSRLYQLNWEVLERRLAQAPPEGTGARAGGGVKLSVPTPDGRFKVFRIEESPILPDELARKFPGINTYRGQGVDDPAATIRLDRTPLGFHATVVSSDGVFFVEPESLDERDHYVSHRLEGEGFECLVESVRKRLPALRSGRAPAISASGTTLRRYRLAVAATGEYTQFFGSQANALAAITTTVNSVDAIYNVEVATQLDLVANNNVIVFTDPSTDPFPLADKNAETQAAIDADIGDANYDIGHLFHKAGSSISGNAGCIGCICSSGTKGSGWSQGPNPGNSNFTFVVTHEMGHQHGANHTWNGPGCGGEMSATRYEPGSGTTIMSYSSICGADNIQGSQVGDLYFHAGSRAQVTAYTQSGGGNACGTPVATGNSVPVASAGADYTIPRGTPFVLTASATDADGEALTYCWEQYDIGVNAALNAVDEGTIPLFRSFPPTTSAARTFPQFSDLLAGGANLFPSKLGEQLPATDRSMNFRVGARDNRSGGGAADDDQMTITVSGDPFEITAPGAGGTLECGSSGNVTWDVGGGSVAPTVDIRLSTNGGLSFPTILAAGTANDGSQIVSIPAVLSANTRLRINSVGNVFFALSPQISIEDTLDPAIVCPANVIVECTGNNGIPASDPQIATFLAGASATDACDPSVAISDNAPAFFPLGPTVVSFTATDDSGNTAQCASMVTVADTHPPTITASVSPDLLWPPNHTLRTIVATVAVTDVCDPNPTFTLTSIMSNEPDNGLGDGNTINDIQGASFGTADTVFELRAERSGPGDGRVYSIVYTGADGSGNTAAAGAVVEVPKSQGH